MICMPYWLVCSFGFCTSVSVLVGIDFCTIKIGDAFADLFFLQFVFSRAFVGGLCHLGTPSWQGGNAVLWCRHQPLYGHGLLVDHLFPVLRLQ